MGVELVAYNPAQTNIPVKTPFCGTDVRKRHSNGSGFELVSAHVSVRSIGLTRMMIKKSRTQFMAPGTIRTLSPLTQCPGCVRSQKRCIGVLHLVSSLFLVWKVADLPLEDRREDRRSVIGCYDTNGDI